MSAPNPVSNEKPKFEVADVFQRYWETYEKTRQIPFHTQKLVWDIVHCRTPLMGGHTRKCSCCGFKQNEYNSCRNRHCPKCFTLV